MRITTQYNTVPLHSNGKQCNAIQSVILILNDEGLMLEKSALVLIYRYQPQIDK